MLPYDQVWPFPMNWWQMEAHANKIGLMVKWCTNVMYKYIRYWWIIIGFIAQIIFGWWIFGVCVCGFCCMLCNLAFHFIHTNVFYDDGSFHFGIYILSFVFADLFLFSSVALMAATTVDVCTNMRIVYVMESTSHLFGCVATLLKTIDNLNWI